MLNSVRPDVRGGRLVFLNEGDPGSAEHYIFRLKRSGLMQKA